MTGGDETERAIHAIFNALDATTLDAVARMTALTHALVAHAVLQSATRQDLDLWLQAMTGALDRTARISWQFKQEQSGR